MSTVVVSPSTTNTNTLTLNADDILEVREGSQQIAGADESGDDLQDVSIFPGFTGSFGTASSPVTLAISNVTTNADPTLSVDSPGGTSYVASGGNGIDIARYYSGRHFLTGGTTATVYVYGGTLEIGASAVVTTLYVYGGTVIIQDNATAITTAYVSGGQIENVGRVFTTANHSEGVVVLRSDAAVTTYNASGGAVLRHRSTGTITTLNMDGTSTYDPSGALTNTTLTTVNLRSSNVRYYAKAGGISANAGTLNNPAGATLFNAQSAAPIGI